MNLARHDLSLLRQVVSSAAAADYMDSTGSRTHCLPHAIRGMSIVRTPMVGYAYPVTTESVDVAPEQHYVGLLASLDAVEADDVYLISSLGRDDVALWGELLSTSCQAKGVAGVVCDGLVRDMAQVDALGFPCFARGTAPYDINGRMEIIDHGKPLEMGGVKIHLGDLIIGDADGIVVVPERLIEGLLETVVEKKKVEIDFLEALRSGMKISDAFAEFQIL